MCSGELRSDLMLRLREGRCGEVEVGKEHPPLDMLETARGETKDLSQNTIASAIQHYMLNIYSKSKVVILKVPYHAKSTHTNVL